MSVESEIPVPVGYLEVQTVIELWRSAFSCHVPVSFRDGSVAVEILELVLKRPSVRGIFLSVKEVCVRFISYHLAAEIAAGAFGYGAGFDVVVLVFSRIQLSEDRTLEGSVESCLDAPVRVLHGYAADGEFQSPVADGADVGHQLVTEIRAHRYLDRIQKILCVTHICIDASAETVIEESEVQTGVPCQGGLPSYERVVCLRGQCTHEARCAHVVEVVRVI